jgi:beta-xylosidase
MKTISTICTFAFILFLNPVSIIPVNAQAAARNPIIWADVPDPSVIRVDDSYYMSSTTMHMSPGVPIMKSMDLVNWETVNYAYDILANTDAMNLSNGQNAYGKGSWASSLRYHDSTFYVVTFSYTTGKTHIYQTDDIENGSWTSYTINTVFHDPSLLFDDERVFLVYGVDDIKIIELTSDVTAIKPGGLNQVLIPEASQIAGSNFYVSAEGSHIHKINDMYYVFLITWPAGSMRTELVYRADSLTGIYEGRIVLQDDGVAQGGIVETSDGNWYGVLFQDHDAVGRIPYLVPVTWEDGWPVFGVSGQVPVQLDIPVENDTIPEIVASDEFDWESVLPLVWQWNHNPDSDYWSVTDRPGYLRLTNGRIDTSFVTTQNTLTQRTFGPECSGNIAMDISNMKDGDVAGLGALCEVYGFVAVKMSGTSKSVIMVNGSSGKPVEVESIPLTQNIIYLQIAFNFTNKIDRAYFYYSLDGTGWNRIGNILYMNYTLTHFMGYRFALFNYATESTGGHVDFDYFRINNTYIVPTAIKEIKENAPEGFNLHENYPNPFNPSTEIHYDVSMAVNVRINVYDITGRHVQTLVNEKKSSGNYAITFDASNLSSGLYLYRMKAGNFVQTRQMMVIK